MENTKQFILIILTVTSFIHCKAQEKSLEELCSILSSSMYEEPFDYNRINSNLSQYQSELKYSTREEYEKCNCADSLWVLRHTHKYQYIKRTHSTILDTIQFLNSMSHEIDKMNLNSELRFQKPKTLVDTFKIVIERLRIKQSKEKYIYNLITAEIDFLKTNKYSITDEYFKIIDNRKSDPEIVDDILVSLFNSNNQISNEIKSRIGKQQYEKHFYRMLGIINTSSSNEFPRNEIDILKAINYQIDEEKVNYIITSFYKKKSNDLRKLKRKQKRRIRATLTNPYLDTMESVIKLINNLK